MPVKSLALLTVFVLGLMALVPVTRAQSANRFYKTRDANEVQAFVRTHRKSVFVFGSGALTTDFEQSLLEGIKIDRSSVRVITDASALARFTALSRAGAQVRYRTSRAVSKNGYANTVALFEDRWLLIKSNTAGIAEWQLIDSPETVAQIKSRLELFWSYCTPVKAG
jgi:hypothetical protein